MDHRSQYTSFSLSPGAQEAALPVSTWGKWASQIEAEQVHLLYAHASATVTAAVLNVGLTLWVFWNTAPRQTLLVWSAVTLTVSFLRLLLAHCYHRASPGLGDTRRWRTRFIIGAGAAGISWGAAGIVLFPADSLPYQVFLVYMLGGMVIGASAVLSSVLAAYWALLLPTALPIFLQLLLQGNSLSFAMGLMLAGGVTVFIFSARQVHASITESIRLRFENLDLVHSLSVAKEQTESANRALQHEVTERRRAEEQLTVSLQEKEVLLQEIHHRVKNNLQIISSLLNLQARALANPDALAALKESQNRVRTMSLLHEKLYQSQDLARINFATYIRELAGYLFRAYHTQAQGVTLHTEVEAIALNIALAVPCGLIISELVSNALKYAFPDGRPGEIAIRLRMVAEQEYQLTVSDNGIGLPHGLNLQAPGSLGLRIVNTLTRQLGGTLTHANETGTTFSLTFPLHEEDEDVIYEQGATVGR